MVVSLVGVRALTAATVLGTFLVAGAAFRVGHAGGQLVYVHNAATAYSPNRDSRANAGKQTNTGGLERTGSAAHDDD
jgi:hypothetical protein